MSIVKSLSVGNGDMFYIRHGSDNFTIIDCCMTEDDEVEIVNEIKAQSADKGISRFISTHPDDDHIRGLVYLQEQINVVNFYCVKNAAIKTEECWTEDFGQYCELRNDTRKAFYVYRGCARKWLNQDDDVRGAAGINFFWPITDNEDYKDALTQAAEGESPNNISPIFTYSIKNGAVIIWMGDLDSDFQERIKDQINLPQVDVLFAPHHGRGTGKVVTEWLEQMAPNLIIIGEAPSEYLDYYEGYNTITQNSAGDITLDCDGDKIYIYVSMGDYEVDSFDNEWLPNAYGGKHIGTLNTKGGN
jgi:beta-lactamase superfamily II metal-dependent hydrolase